MAMDIAVINKPAPNCSS